MLPPTLHCDEPNPRLELEKTPFYLNTENRPWVHGASWPRRAGVNAFGFGGINAHLVVEEYTGTPSVYGTGVGNGTPGTVAQVDVRALATHAPGWDSEVCLLEAESPAELAARARLLSEYLEAVDATPEAPRLFDVASTLNQQLNQTMPGYRLAVVATSIADLRQKLGRAIERLADPACARIKDVKGIYYAAEPLGRQGKLAFLFPGEGSQYPNMLADLCLHFPEVRAWFDRADQLFDGPERGYAPSDFIFPRRAFSDDEGAWADQRLTEMDGAVAAVLAANRAMFSLLSNLGLRPDVIVGHSTGDYSALAAAGVLDFDAKDQLDAFSSGLTQVQASSQDRLGQAVLLAIGADREQADAIVAEAGGDLFVAMDNCPHQVVLVGDVEAAERAVEIVKREMLIYERLTFDRAYHTPLFGPYADGLRALYMDLPIRPPITPVYSCTTTAAYPTDPDAIRDVMVDHWVKPVELRATLDALYQDGVRLFVEVGARGNLTTFVEDSLRGQAFCAVPVNVQRRSGITQLNHLVGLLSVHGVALDFGHLYQRRRPRLVAWEDGANRTIAANPPPSSRIALNSGWPMMRLDDDAVRRIRAGRACPVERAACRCNACERCGDEPAASRPDAPDYPGARACGG